MVKQTGTNLSDVKSQNRALILKLIATERFVSRSDLSRITGLTKTTSSKIVSELISEGIIHETTDTSIEIENTVGRKPTFLDISPNSPCVCGMLIKRGLCSVILADYKCRILYRENYQYDEKLTGNKLVDILIGMFERMKAHQTREIIAIGIASVGPVNIAEQKIANPPNFYGINNLPIAQIIREKTGLPTFIMSDAGAGALAEKIYGKGKRLDNFIYLHIMNGIGSGYILKNNIYSGDMGQSGEIGHTSINFSGPICDCGNIGCLELYANIQNMNKKIASLKKVYQKASILPENKTEYTWVEIIDAANQQDFFAISALDEFCEYVSYALVNTINLLDISHILVGYDSSFPGDIFESMLSVKLNAHVLVTKSRSILIEKSGFNGDAPLMGTIALLTDKIFNCQQYTDNKKNCCFSAMINSKQQHE